MSDDSNKTTKVKEDEKFIKEISAQIKITEGKRERKALGKTLGAMLNKNNKQFGIKKSLFAGMRSQGTFNFQKTSNII